MKVQPYSAFLWMSFLTSLLSSVFIQCWEITDTLSIGNSSTMAWTRYWGYWIITISFYYLLITNYFRASSSLFLFPFVCSNISFLSISYFSFIFVFLFFIVIFFFIISFVTLPLLSILCFLPDSLPPVQWRWLFLSHFLISLPNLFLFLCFFTHTIFILIFLPFHPCNIHIHYCSWVNILYI